MHKITPGSSKNTQNPIRNFQKGTKPQRSSKNAQNPMRNFKKCTKFNEELQKMHKIPAKTSKYAQNPTRIFRKCARSHH
jgi:hypothetical protein